MPFAIFELPTLWLTTGSYLAFLIAVAAGTVTVFRAQHAESDHVERLALLPSMEALQTAAVTLVERRRDVAETTERLRELLADHAQTERHRLKAEHWRSMAEQAERDYRDKIEEIRTRYEEAAKDLTERRSEIGTLIEHRNRLVGEIGGMKSRFDDPE